MSTVTFPTDAVLWGSSIGGHSVTSTQSKTTAKYTVKRDGKELKGLGTGEFTKYATNVDASGAAYGWSMPTTLTGYKSLVWAAGEATPTVVGGHGALGSFAGKTVVQWGSGGVCAIVDGATVALLQAPAGYVGVPRGVSADGSHIVGEVFGVGIAGGPRVYAEWDENGVQTA